MKCLKEFGFHGVNETAEADSAVSIRLQKRIQQKPILAISESNFSAKFEAICKPDLARESGP
jgi:hypothetical protein